MGRTMQECVQYIIENFESKYADNIAEGLYDKRDLDRLQTDLSFGAQYVRSEHRLDEGVDLMHGSFKFRQELGINNVHEHSFTRELWDVKGMYFRGRDNQGTRVFWLNVRAHRRDNPSERQHAEKLGLVYGLDRAFKENPRQQIVVCLDMWNTGIANLDLDFVKYILNQFKVVYPTFLCYFLIYDMPWLFNAAWKVVKAWLSEEAANRIKFVTKGNIQDYINPEHLPLHCGGTDECAFEYYEGICDVPLYPEDVEEQRLKEERKKVKFCCQEVTFHESLSNTPTTAMANTNASNSNSNGLRQRNHNNNNARERGEAVVNGFDGDGEFTVSPSEYMHFEVYEAGGDSFETISMTNTLGYDIVFKVKTTSPEKYRVRPSAGIVEPGKTEVVHVYLVHEHADNVTKDKFLIMAVDGTDRDTSDLNQLWKEISKSEMMEHKLKCTVEKLEGEGPFYPGARSSVGSAQSRMSKYLQTAEPSSKSLGPSAQNLGPSAQNLGPSAQNLQVGDSKSASPFRMSPTTSRSKTPPPAASKPLSIESSKHTYAKPSYNPIIPATSSYNSIIPAPSLHPPSSKPSLHPPSANPSKIHKNDSGFLFDMMIPGSPAVQSASTRGSKTSAISTYSRVAKPAMQDDIDLQIEKLEKQNDHMQRQLNLLLVLQIVTAGVFLLMMLSYSCFGEELFTRFLALPFDFCGDKYGRKC